MSEIRLYKDRNLQIVFGITLMMVLGIPSVIPAFPRIVEALHISRTDVGMLIVAFTLPSVVIAPFLGVLADRFGRKRLIVPSLFLFGLAGGACALSRDFNTLVILRAVQGIGAAGLGGLNVAIIGDLFSGERRVEAMGLNVTVLSVGAAAYPLIGGALAELAWNYPFLLALAGLPIGFLTLRFLRYPEPRSTKSLSEYLSGTWSYLKNIRVISAFLAGIIAFIILHGAYLTYFGLFLNDSFQVSPFIIGGFASVLSVSTGLCASQLGRLIKVVSEVNLVKLGLALSAIALASIPFIPRLWLLLIPTIIFGVGHGIIFPSLQAYIAALAPPEYRAVFMSVISTMFRLGQVIGPLLIGLAYVYGDFAGAFLLAAGLALVTAIVGVIGGKVIR